MLISAVRKLCNREGCSGHESCRWRRSSFFRRSGTLLSPIHVHIWYSQELITHYNSFLCCGFVAVFRVSGQVWEEVCDARSIRYKKHLPVTWFGMDTAPYLPTWASSPYSCQNTWSILQPRCHKLSLFEGTFMLLHSRLIWNLNHVWEKEKLRESWIWDLFFCFFFFICIIKVCVGETSYQNAI